MGESRRPHTLILVPTALEQQHVATHPIFHADATTELCGFGPVAAAARASHLITKHSPDRVILTGIAGSFDTTALPPGTAAIFPATVMYGVGKGVAPQFMSAAAMGFPHWLDDAPPSNGSDGRVDILTTAPPLPPTSGPMLTCCSVSATPRDAQRRRTQYPTAVAEDMEAFAVALACRLTQRPLVIVKGVSNPVGDRAFERWKVREAMEAALPLIEDVMGRSWETSA